MSKRAERLEVVLSDNIRLRCGCRRATVLALRELVLAPTRRKAHLLIVAVICQRCGAGWEWGEVCAAPEPTLGDALRRGRAICEDLTREARARALAWARGQRATGDAAHPAVALHRKGRRRAQPESPASSARAGA